MSTQTQNSYFREIFEPQELTGKIQVKTGLSSSQSKLEIMSGRMDEGINDPASPFFSLQRGRNLKTGVGFGAFQLGDRRFETNFSKDDYFITPPDTATEYLIDEPFNIEIFAWPKKYLRNIISTLVDREITDLGPLHSAAIHSPEISAVFRKIWRETQSGNPNGAMFIETGSLSLIAILAEKAFGGPQNIGSLPEMPDWRLRRVSEWIEDNIASDISIDDIARVAGMSSTTLSRAFRNSLNMSPYQYLVSRRIQRAKILLAYGKETILNVSLSVGYDNPQHFATLFKKTVGGSPSNYRKDFK